MRSRAPKAVVVSEPVSAFRALLDAARSAGVRTGWLDLETPPPVAEGLEQAAEGGVLRAVAVGGGRVVSHKRVAGPPVLADLLREHFKGCAWVLVRAGEAVGPLDPELSGLLRLTSDGDGWRLESGDRRGERLTAEELLERLRARRGL